jgi:hypothetical protein
MQIVADHQAAGAKGIHPTAHVRCDALPRRRVRRQAGVRYRVDIGDLEASASAADQRIPLSVTGDDEPNACAFPRNVDDTRVEAVDQRRQAQ